MHLYFTFFNFFLMRKTTAQFGSIHSILEEVGSKVLEVGQVYVKEHFISRIFRMYAKFAFIFVITFGVAIVNLSIDLLEWFKSIDSDKAILDSPLSVLSVFVFFIILGWMKIESLTKK